MFTSLNDPSVESVTRALLALPSLPSWSRWCEQWAALEQYLDDQHTEDTRKYAAKAYPESSKQWVEQAAWALMPIVPMFASRLSVTFDVAPTTSLRWRGLDVPEEHPWTQQWRRDEEELELPSFLQSLERRVTATNAQFVSPTWLGDSIRWQRYSPHDVRILKGQVNDLRHARAVAFGHTDSNGQREWLVWGVDVTGRRFGVVTTADGRVMRPALFQDGVNPYGCHPAVLWQWREPPTGEIVVPPSEPLLAIQRRQNTGWTDLHHGLKFHAHPISQMFGQPRNLDGDMVAMMPGQPLQFGDDKNQQGLVFVSPQLNVAEHRTTLEQDLQAFAVMNNLPPDTFSAWSPTRNLGAKQEETAELDRIRDQRMPLAKRHLKRTFAVHVAVGNVWARVQAMYGAQTRTEYPADIELHVEFAPRRRIEDRQAAAQSLAIEVPLGLAGLVETVMSRSGVTRPEAIAIILRRLQDEAQIEQMRTRLGLEAAPTADPAPAAALSGGSSEPPRSAT